MTDNQTLALPLQVLLSDYWNEACTAASYATTAVKDLDRAICHEWQLEAVLEGPKPDDQIAISHLIDHLNSIGQGEVALGWQMLLADPQEPITVSLRPIHLMGS